jgi:hypothetical protein
MSGTVNEPVAFFRCDNPHEEFWMRASHIAVIAAVLATPSLAYAQQDGPVGGRVGSDHSTSTTQPGLAPSARPYAVPDSAGRSAGFAGATTPGQVLPNDVQVAPRPGGGGTAYVNGHRVLVDPSNRILRVIN